jgi:ABC-type dipeptide/oligopeptide/nickel transport system permease component
MQHPIGASFILGLTIVVLRGVWNSKFFSKKQKIAASVFALFPPGMIGLLLLMAIYNWISPTIISKSQELSESLIDKSGKALDKLYKLNDLKEKGVISEAEFNRLSEKLKKDL